MMQFVIKNKCIIALNRLNPAITSSHNIISITNIWYQDNASLFGSFFAWFLNKVYNENRDSNLERERISGL